jgi:hypothetical protein
MIKERLGSRILWGVRWGVYYAAVLVAWITLIRIVRGTEPFQRQGVAFTQVLLLYVLGAPITGAIVGILFPFTRTATGAAVVGVVAAIPVSFATITMVADQPPGTKVHTFATIMMAVSGGAMCGVMLRAWLGGRAPHEQANRSHR